MSKRASGILIHITSLYSQFGIGDLGNSSYEFIDLLSESKQKYWQILPINPTESVYGHSPYSSPSSFAGNPLIISPNFLYQEGYIPKLDIANLPEFPEDRVDFEMISSFKEKLLEEAFESNLRGIVQHTDFKKFCLANKNWLDDYCLYSSIKKDSKYSTWKDFPIDLRDRKKESLAKWQEKERHHIIYNKFVQYIFFKQWEALKKYAQDKSVKIIGDLPYYVNYDSSDVWANQEIFKLDDNKDPLYIAGVPPDYFSETGQLWGNPVYNWKRLNENSYSWWFNRIRHNLSMFDKLRLDHFRGFVSYWEVKAGEKNAINGEWIHLDPYSFFDKLFLEYDKNKIIAEDLGIITDDVKELIHHYNLPGMKILLFAFGDDYPYGDYLPTNVNDNCIMYTGTHDNNTVTGWWNDEANENERNRVREYLNKDINNKNINWELIEAAMGSRAETVIFPMQDLLGLGASARMNTPSTTSGNWMWRLNSQNNLTEIVEKLSGLSDYYDRG